MPHPRWGWLGFPHWDPPVPGVNEGGHPCPHPPSSGRAERWSPCVAQGQGQPVDLARVYFAQLISTLEISWMAAEVHGYLPGQLLRAGSAFYHYEKSQLGWTRSFPLAPGGFSWTPVIPIPLPYITAVT